MTRVSQPSTRPLLLATLVSLSLVVLAAMLAAYDDQQQRVSLSILKPAIDYIIPLTRDLEFRSHEILGSIKHALLAVAALLAAGQCIFFRSVKPKATILLLGTISAIYGQICLALKETSTGGWCYLGALILLLAYIQIGRRENVQSERSTPAFGYFEASILVSIFTIGLILRFYALNWFFNFFEGEHSPFCAAANDLRGMTLAAVSHNGPFSPIGYNFYLIAYVLTNIFGTTILTLRFTTAIPAMVMIFLSYFFLRSLFSRTVALASILILAIDGKQLGWCRFEYPHHMSAFYAMLISWLAYLTFSSKNVVYPFLLTLVMGYSFHQYPSGQTSFIIPWLYLAYLLVFNREYRWTFYAARVPFLMAGVALWYYGDSISIYLAYGELRPPAYFSRFDGRISWRNLQGDLSILEILMRMGAMYWQNVLDLFGSMAVRLSHGHPPQEYTPDFGYLSLRTVFLLVPPFFLVGLARFFTNMKWKEGAILLAWIAAGCVPSILSNEGLSRRAASIFPALIFFAATGFELARNAVLGSGKRRMRFLVYPIELVTACALVLATFHQMFSGAHQKIAEPAENAVVRKLTEMIKPNSLVFVDFVEHWMTGKLTYLMLDFLNNKQNQPIAWLILEERFKQKLLENPSTPSQAVPLLRSSMFVEWTGLWSHLPQVESNQNWNRLVYVLIRFPNTPADSPHEALYSAMKSSCVGDIQEVYLSKIPNLYHEFKIFSCEIAKQPSPNPPS
jgi:hypothetical protein